MANNDVDVNWRYIARLRFAGLLVILGLAIQLATMLVPHPMSFIAFMVAGIGLVAIGVLALLWALVRQ